MRPKPPASLPAKNHAYPKKSNMGEELQFQNGYSPGIRYKLKENMELL